MVDSAPPTDSSQQPTQHDELPDRLRVHQLARALGSTNTAIARKLGISPRTVAHHLDSAYRKLDVTSRAAAVYRAVNEGLVPGPERQTGGSG